MAEKKPVLVIAVGRGGKTTLYELDANGAVISRDDVHAGRVPVLWLGAEDFSGGAGTERTRGLISLLARIRRTHPALYRELAEIGAADGGIRVRLRGRKTGYILGTGTGDIAKLSYVAGYCDRSGRYPDEINLTGNAVIVR